MIYFRIVKFYVRKRKSEDIGLIEMNLMGYILVIFIFILEAKVFLFNLRWK